MELKAGLWQKQTIKLAMTQELTQAIALLQYSAQELTSFLEEKAIENPLLQVEYDHVHSIDQFKRPKSKKTSTVNSGEGDQKNWIEQIGENATSLQDHLRFQLNIYPLKENEQKVVSFFISQIDENGYLGVGIEEACARLGVAEEVAEHSLTIIQGLDPAGVGARSLQECLLLQLNLEDEHKQHPKICELLKRIIETDFVLFAEKKWKSLAKTLNVSLKEIQKAFDYVQTLNPRPGAIFQNERTAYVTPDVIVELEGDTLTVGLIDDTIPKLSFNQQYYQELAGYKDKEVSRFLQEKQSDFQWIARSLEQRRETLMKVAYKMVEKQSEFFKQGPAFLKPMTMREISEELDIHESTVSRAVREKYIQTPCGLFEMRSLFSSSIATTEQEQTSSSHAKAAIELLVKNEDKRKPLSDQEIVRLLSDRSGINISRRTVAKYRDQLGILSSSKRKRYE